jgi:hypothetical protein
MAVDEHLRNALVVQVHDPGGNLVELGLDAGAKPALSSDELVTLADGPHQDRLEHAVLAERISQGSDLRGWEMAARLIRIGIDLVHRDVDQLGAR